MGLRKGQLQTDGRPAVQRAGFSTLAGVMLLSIAVAGCSPIATWRAVNGIDKNDPDPKTAPFTENMAKAANEPYPNLASVPPPPTRETSTADREKLTQALLTDRAATAAEARPPPSAAAGATPVPPPPTTIAAAAPAAQLTLPAATPMPSAAPPTPPSPATAPAVAMPAAAASAAAAPAVATSAAAAPGKTASAAAKPGATQAHARKPGEPPEAPPLNSTLVMPQILTTPEPEAPRPPPPAARLAALPPPSASAGPSPAAVASATPVPAPAVPVLPPIAPPPAPAKPLPKPPATTTVATLDIARPDAAPSAVDRTEIERVAGLYKEKPGIVRVVAYAAAPAAGADPLASYRAALDRAQAIARELAKAGIPADKVQTEATPSGGAQIGRVEIQLAR